MKDIKITFTSLRNRIAEYRKNYYESLHPALKFDINAVEIALNLAEIHFHHRNLTDKELEWFRGKRFIEDTFQNEWKDIADNYLIITEFIKSGNHLRA